MDSSEELLTVLSQQQGKLLTVLSQQQSMDSSEELLTVCRSNKGNDAVRWTRAAVQGGVNQCQSDEQETLGFQEIAAE